MKYLLKTLFLFSLVHSSLYAKSKEINFSIVISGGVSLGAYEAGCNWALIKILTKLRASKETI